MATIARIIKAHGHRGEMAVELLRPWPHGLKWVWLTLDGIPVPWHIDEVRPRGSASVLLTLRGIGTLEQASALAGHDLSADDEVLRQLTPDDEDTDDGMYMADLVGYTLRDSDGTAVGVIDDWDDSTANVLLHVLRPDASIVTVPLADDLVRDLDTDARSLTLDIPEGLL